MNTEESVYLHTGDLTKKLEHEKNVKFSNEQVKHDDKKKYEWKISVVEHRKRKQAWEVFIIIVALYSVLVIPIRIAINTQLLEPAYDTIDLITWFIYIIDVFVNVRTTYIDNFGLEVTDGNRIMMKYVGSFRFIVDILSLCNAPNFIVSGAGETTLIILNMLGLLKLSRYFRAQSLIIQSRLQKDQKAQANCGFYFVLLLIYLHMIGCLFFFFCLQTYETSSTRVGILEELGLRQVDASTSLATYPFPEFEDKYETAAKAVTERAEEMGRGSTILAWVPAYDNYDGSEKFWRHYELSLLDEDQKLQLN